MQFLYPGFLWALFIALVPIIIHLFTFRRYKTVYFSNVAFLQNIQKESKSRSRLKNLLLLLIRVLSIVFLVLVFAKPVLTKDQETVVANKTVVGVYIDNSFSMEASGKYGKLLEFSKMKAVEIAGEYDLNTLFLLTTNDFELKHQKLINKEQFIDWVTQIKPSHISRDFKQVYEHQNHLFQQVDTLAVIKQFVFSDFQKYAFNTEYYPSNARVKTNFIPLKHQEVSNVFIDSVWFKSPGHYLSKHENLLVKVTNFSDQEVFDLQVNLYINDSLKAISNQSFLPYESKVLEMAFVQTKTGWSKARVELSDYPITFDNTLFFSFFIDEQIPVFEIVESDKIHHAKALFENDKNFSYSASGNNGSYYNELSKYKVIVLNQLTELSTGLISALKNASKQGSRLVIIPPVDVNLIQYNSLLSGIRAPKYRSWKTESGKMQGIDFEHEYFKDAVKPVGDQVRLPDYNGYYLCRAASNSNTNIMLETESGNPIVLMGSNSESDFVLFTIPLAESVTNFSTHPLFVPLLYNAALYSVRFNDLYHVLEPNLVVDSRLEATSNVELVDTVNNMRFRPKVIGISEATRLFMDESNINAGHLSVEVDRQNQGLLSFNYSRNESIMEFYTTKELNDYLALSKTENLSLINTDEFSLYSEIKAKTGEKSLSQMLLWLVLALIIGEVLLLKYLK